VGNDHGYLVSLKRLILELDLSENVTVHENISYNNLKDFYDSSYLYVNTANTKLACMGLSMKEAMAAELPVIASDVGGIPEAVIDGVTGFIFRVDDHQQLASQIARLLDDPSLARKFGKAGRNRAEELFDRNFSNKKVLDLIDKMETTQ
jgi:glycosyltransferase involved in cell wall biosynthesis